MLVIFGYVWIVMDYAEVQLQSDPWFVISPKIKQIVIYDAKCKTNSRIVIQKDNVKKLSNGEIHVTPSEEITPESSKNRGR